MKKIVSKQTSEQRKPWSKEKNEYILHNFGLDTQTSERISKHSGLKEHLRAVLDSKFLSRFCPKKLRSKYVEISFQDSNLRIQ